MKNSIITEAQIIKAIKEYEGGRELNNVCREPGVINPPFYNWRKKCAGMNSPGVKMTERVGGIKP
jgi:putative transposase